MVVVVPPDLGAEVDLTFPSMHAARRIYAAEEVPEIPVDDVPERVRAELGRLRGRVAPGERVAITAGSRGIANMAAIVRACGVAIRAAGGDPFVMPAMGSHGGATAEGQVEMLAGYGITEAAMGMPVVSSMEVRQIGQLAGGTPVYMSVTALEADRILVVNRVKPHTDFRAPIESGLAKICAIGMGKQKGAQTIHSNGTRGLAELMPQVARSMIETTGKIVGGLAILENAYDHTADLVWVEPDGIAASTEVELQRRAKALMPSLPFDDIDVLVVDEMGKNVSGAGMDPNILGRMLVPGVPEFERPRVTAVVVLDLTDESHGNAVGLGLADFTTERVVAKVDWQATYVNGYTSGTGGLMRGRLPMAFPTDRAAIATAMRMSGRPDPAQVRVVRIKNTLMAAFPQISANLLPEAAAARLEVLGEARPLSFDGDGRLQ